MATAFLDQVRRLLTYELTNSTQAILATSTTIGGSAAATATVAADFVASGGPTLTGGLPFPGKSYIDSTPSSYIVNSYASPGTVINSSDYYTGYTFRFTLPATGAANWSSGFTYRVRYSPLEEIVFYTEDGNYQNAYLRQGGSIIFNLFSNVTPTAGLTYILQVSNGLATLSKIDAGQVTLLGSAIMTKQPQRISMITGGQGTGFSNLYFSGTPMADDSLTIANDYATNGDSTALYGGNPFTLQQSTPGVNWANKTFRCGPDRFFDPFTTPLKYSRFQWRLKLVQGAPADYTFYVDQCQLTYTANNNRLTLTNLDTNETEYGDWNPAANEPILITYNRGIIQVYNLSGSKIGGTSMILQYAQLRATLSQGYDGFDDMYFTYQGDAENDDYIEVADDWRQNGGVLEGGNPFLDAASDPNVEYSYRLLRCGPDPYSRTFYTGFYNRFQFRFSIRAASYYNINPLITIGTASVRYTSSPEEIALYDGNTLVGSCTYRRSRDDCVFLTFFMGRLDVYNLAERKVGSVQLPGVTTSMSLPITTPYGGIGRVYFNTSF